jgi:hypothetical protein
MKQMSVQKKNWQIQGVKAQKGRKKKKKATLRDTVSPHLQSSCLKLIFFVLFTHAANCLNDAFHVVVRFH